MNSIQLLEQGAKLEDELHIGPFKGNRKKIHLKRTKYRISSHHLNKGIVQNGNEIQLPSFKGEEFSFVLEMNKNGVFILEAIQIPFKINGAWSFKSFVGKGDEIDIGLNRLVFSKTHEVKEKLCPLLNEKIIMSSLNILIEGETGTGKSRLALKIHEGSGKRGPFIHLNLSAYPLSLIESELFGHKKGAFTGALVDKRGALEICHEGTLFLDEIDSLPIEIQTKLLLFLDNQRVRKLGDFRDRQVKVRLIFASGKRLEDLVFEKKIRNDFYYRMASGFKIQLNSLRENKEKIDELLNDWQVKKGITFSKSLVNFYKLYPWPGNIRQFISHLNKKEALSISPYWTFDKADDSLVSGPSDYLFEKTPTLQELKCSYTFKVYLKLQRNINKTAELIGVSPNTVRTLVDKFEANLQGCS